MIENVRLYVEAVASSVVSVGAIGAAAASDSTLVQWLFGGGGALAFIAAVFAYGQLVGRVSSQREDIAFVKKAVTRLANHQNVDLSDLMPGG